MSPAFATRLATHLFPYRGFILAVSLLGMALLFVTISWGSAGAVVIATALGGPLIGVPWALLCACVWLHPEHGKLRLHGGRFGRLPRIIQHAVRWYASLFLGLFVFVGLILWPMLSLV